jgi:argininosuccinate lyase
MAKKLWGGRFEKKSDPLVEEFTKSIQYDCALAPYDIIGSLAHVQILYKSGYLKRSEFQRLAKGLADILKQVLKHSFKFGSNKEDIHTAIQNAMEKRVGPLAEKMHTARSRNDQVAFATKLYSAVKLQAIQLQLFSFKAALTRLSKRYPELIVPGFTHLQHAQPINLSDYLAAYEEMFSRDVCRILDLRFGIEEYVTMGAGALAGTPIPARDYSVDVSKYIKYCFASDAAMSIKVKAGKSSVDAVSDRDFVIEIISALSILAMHISRLAEDLIIWSSKEFGFVEIDDAFCTGSSLMPQKKNPDVLELVRGYAGRLYGNLVSVLTMMKGLPLTYNRDMQLDKEPLFNSFEIVSSELKVLAGLIKTLKFNEEKIKEQLKDESLYATDIVYYLVDKGIPFKEAHTIVGKLVKHSIDNGIQIKDMPEDKLKQFCKKFMKKEVVKLFDPSASVRSKKSIRR